MSFNYKFPEIDEIQISNGLRILLVPDSEQDGMVTVMQFPFGRFCDPEGYEGLSELTISLLQKGTRNISSEQFAEKLEFAGANLMADSGEEHLSIGLRMLSRYQEELLPLFFEMIMKPGLDSGEFTRLQKEMFTSLQAETVDQNVIANRHFYLEIAGKKHPAGKFHTLESVKRIKLPEVKKFYDDYFSPEGAILAVAGNFDVNQFKSRWLPVLESWDKKRTGKVCIADEVTFSGVSIRLIDKPELTQTSLILGHPAPGELNPDKNEIALANYILGAGNFSSRLMNRIRSFGGKTYGISSQITSERKFGTFTISTSTQNNQLGEVLKSILDVYSKFCNEGVTEEELGKAARFAIGNLAFQLEGIGNVAEKLLWLRFYDRPNSYIENFEEMINKISLDSINKVIKNHFSPDNMAVVAVGRKKEIIDQIKPFGDVKQFHFRDRF
jgi:zinc protease